MQTPSYSIEELKSFQHPSEKSRFFLALLISVPVALMFLVLTFASSGAVLAVLLMLAFLFWLSHKITKVLLMANCIHVSAYNFPQIHAVVEEARAKLAYSKAISVFVISEGAVNAFVASFFRTRFIVLNSGLVEEMMVGKDLNQLEWIVGRFIGALKTKQLQFELLDFIVAGIENLKFLNFFILPYERATQYSGDNFGLILSGDLQASLTAFNKFFVGNKLASHISLHGLLEQKIATDDSFLATLARWFSPFPHLVHRYLNILAFAQKFMPHQYGSYLASLDSSTQVFLRQSIPDTYAQKRPMRTYGFSTHTQPPSPTTPSPSPGRIQIKVRR
jgi:hypothetical protein